MEYMEQIAAEPLHQGEDIASLDEPVSATLERELRLVGLKLFHVMFPHGKGPATLRDWDLWGPLLFCFLLAAVLTISSEDAAVFTLIFFIVAVGSVVITLNAKLVGAKTSFFQCLSVLGYCIFPLALAALIVDGTMWILVHFFISLAALLWCTWATVPFFGSMTGGTRKFLVIYPVFLFYFFLMWLVFVGKTPHSPAPTPTPTPSLIPFPTSTPTPAPIPSPTPTPNITGPTPLLP